MTEIESRGLATLGAPCLRRLREYLEMAGVAYQVVRHPSRYTAQELAQEEHVPGKLIAKVVLVMADHRLVMAVVPATSRINVPWVRGAVGGEQRAAGDGSRVLERFS